MCLTCGCGKPNDDHGNKANITMKDLQAAAKAGGVRSAKKAAENLEKTVQGEIKPKNGKT